MIPIKVSGLGIDLRYMGGLTSLHYAASYESVQCVELLLVAGADVNVKNKKGQTPLHLASSKGSVRCVELLLAAGANAHVRQHNGFTAVEWARKQQIADMIQVRGDPFVDKGRNVVFIVEQKKNFWQF